MSITRRTFVKRTGAAAGLASTGWLGAPRLSAGAPDLAVSFARRTITPGASGAPPNPHLAGFEGVLDPGAGPRRARGARRDLHARALAFHTAGGVRAIATADVLGFPASLHQKIRDRLMRAGAFRKSADFVLSASNTHNGPLLVDALDPYTSYGLQELDDVEAYGEWLVGAIVQVVLEALDAPRRPCVLDHKVAREGFAFNREGLPDVETDVPILTARDPASGAPIAVLFSYGCHPVAGGLSDRFDPDYPGEAIAAVEARAPFAMFLQGPAGDQDPRGSRGAPLVAELGQRLGRTVAAGLASRGRPVGGAISTILSGALLPFDVPETTRGLVAIRQVYERRFAAHGRADVTGRHAELMIRQIDGRHFPTSLLVPVQAWTFAGAPALKLLLSGGELVSGYAVRCRSRAGGAENVIVTGYANEVEAYVPSDELLPGRGRPPSYAGGWDADAPAVAGGSLKAYGHVAPFRAGPGGAEEAMTRALERLLG